MIVPIILAGGVGSRLWPLSRSEYPKQYNAFLSDASLFQSAIERARAFSDQVMVVAGESHRYLIQDQSKARDVSPTILLEPCPRDTAAAVALAAHYWRQADPLMLVMPADHVIEDQAHFEAAVTSATPFAEQGHLVTFGCRPEHPSTAYGYIQRGAALSDRVYAVKAFCEKPNDTLAQTFLAAGDYDWNAGIFLFKASAFLDELSRYALEIYDKTLLSMSECRVDGCFVRPEASAFESCPKNSLDYAVMEHTDRAAVVPVEMGWSDLGSWQSVHQHVVKDQQSNHFSGDVMAENVENSHIRSSNRLVMALGLKDIVVVETRDAVLVADKSQSESIKQCVKQLEQLDRPESQQHAVVYRPWGSYEKLELGSRFQVKRIIVVPGGCLSLQMHQHRSEHWVILAGEAEITRGDEVFVLGRDQSTYIPTKTKHRLRNRGNTDLEIIEVQVGDYLAEDDIERFEDDYGRANKALREYDHADT
jgi:mannose-1-phosphate guanylyltransferase / mannose-6-phosphate isomerase